MDLLVLSFLLDLLDQYNKALLVLLALLVQCSKVLLGLLVQLDLLDPYNRFPFRSNLMNALKPTLSLLYFPMMQPLRLHVLPRRCHTSQKVDISRARPLRDLPLKSKRNTVWFQELGMALSCTHI